MADIRVTSESLTGVAGQLQNGASSIETQLSNLKSLVDGLVGGDWDGAASRAFSDLYLQWDQSAIQLKEALDGVSDLLTQAALSYEDSETGIQGMFA